MRSRAAVAAGALALTASVVASLAGCTTGTDLSAVARTCTKAVERAMAGAGGSYTAGDFLRFEDGALSVSSPVRGQLGTAVTGVAVGCIIKETQAPASVEARLRDGTVGDGRQAITWADVTMTYRFLPARGLRAVVRLS